MNIIEIHCDDDGKLSCTLHLAAFSEWKRLMRAKNFSDRTMKRKLRSALVRLLTGEFL